MSDHLASDADVSASIVTSKSDDANTQPLALSELSPGDKPWDKHRSFADRVEHYYQASEFQSYSDRIRDCSQLLSFGLEFQEDSSLKLRLRASKFCRVRHCPVCQWRRSLMWKAKAFQVLPRLIEDYPTHRWLFLTLTLKNVKITTLKETLREINTGYRRLSQLKDFPAVGWLKSIEVTKGSDGNAHPHAHCLLLVPSSYFGAKYLSKKKWIEMWRKSMRLDYQPILDIQVVKQGDTPMCLVPELLKYCTKESDMVSDREWFLELTRQMYRVRTISTGGVLKNYLVALERDPSDLIGDGQISNFDLGRVQFGWRKNEKKYRLV